MIKRYRLSAYKEQRLENYDVNWHYTKWWPTMDSAKAEMNRLKSEGWSVTDTISEYNVYHRLHASKSDVRDGEVFAASASFKTLSFENVKEKTAELEGQGFIVTYSEEEEYYTHHNV